MMKNKIFFYSLIVLFLSSCVWTLHPITTNEKDLVFKNELLGRWKDADGASEYLVDRAGDASGKYYKVMILDHKENRTDTSFLLAALANLKGHYFLDCKADTNKNICTSSDDIRSGFFIPSHLIIKVFSFSNNSISLAPIDKDALLNLLKTKKIQISNEVVGEDDILLTEKPEMLRQKLLKLENYPLVYKRDSIIRVP